MAASRMQFKISAKDNTTVTLVPVGGEKSSIDDVGRNITQIVITTDAIVAADDRFFDPTNRVIEVCLERR